MIYQSIAGGVSVIDFDRDLAPDLFFPQSGPWPVQKDASRDQIVRNVRGTAVNVTSVAMPSDQAIGYGAAAGDFNCDGLPDLYVSNFGINQLLANNGDGTFSDVTEDAGIIGFDWTVSSAIADINGDGLPDLYDVNYCDPVRSQTHKCYRAKHEHDSYVYPNGVFSIRRLPSAESWRWAFSGGWQRSRNSRRGRPRAWPCCREPRSAAWA